jgi:hypothetical protein
MPDLNAEALGKDLQWFVQGMASKFGVSAKTIEATVTIFDDLQGTQVSVAWKGATAAEVETGPKRSRVGKTLVKGHGLRSEGQPYVVDLNKQVVRADGWYGRALCSCGWLSEMLDTNNERKRVHRWHKDLMREQDLDA